jgi:hypothetical protein
MVEEHKTYSFSETFERFHTSHDEIKSVVLRTIPLRPFLGRVSGGGEEGWLKVRTVFSQGGARI